jgi:hypothetical protein
MHGSFDTKAVQKFYSFYDRDLAENFSETSLYDFSMTGAKSCSEGSEKEKKRSIAKMHKKAKDALDAANAKVLDEYSEENLHRLALAKQLYDLTSEKFAQEQAEKREELQYSESYGESDLAVY